MAIDPLKYFQRLGRHSEDITILASTAGTFSTGNDQQLVAGVSGKRIRVMGWHAVANTTTAGQYRFEDGSGGSDLTGNYWAPPNTAGVDIFPITDSGYFETTTGTGLYVDVATAGVEITVFYITYTP